MTDTNKDFFKIVKTALIIVGVVILIFILINKCTSFRVGGSTIIKTDTVYIEVKDSKSYIPKVDTILFAKDKVRFKWDTLYLETTLHDTIGEESGNWSTSITDDYFATRIYKDTIRNQYGSVIVKDTISQNKIQGRGYVSDFKVPVITKTITKEQKKRSQLYFGGGVFGNETKMLSGYEAGLMFKTKQDRILSLSYNQVFNSFHYYKASVYFKLSLKKQ